MNKIFITSVWILWITVSVAGQETPVKKKEDGGGKQLNPELKDPDGIGENSERLDTQPKIDASFSKGTTDDPELEPSTLKIILRPQTKTQLEKEAEDWLQLLSQKVREVGTIELELQKEGKQKLSKEEADEQKERLIELRTQEAALIERIRLVLEALKSKGGETEEYVAYIEAISSLEETADSTSYWTAVWVHLLNWLKRDDGGILWLQRIVFALILFLVFWLISKIAGRMVGHLLVSRMSVSTLLENFARKTAGGIVMAVGLLTALSALGVQIGPMLAALGAGGFIVGFALQETLGSFASGLMIMVYRPFDVDDYVSIADVSGTVKEMNLVSTTLLTVDNKVVVIPNRNAWGQTIVNFTGQDLRRVDLIFGIGYGDDIEKAIRVIREVTNAHELILEEPEPMIHVQELADSSVNLHCRPWVKTGDYWTVYSDLLKDVKIRFDAENISIPFPQQDVHMHQN